jgi:hypothetical protein
LLKLVAQSAARAQRYGEELERLVAKQGLHDALVGAGLVVDANGKSHPVGEYVRGLTQLEAAERDRCASMCAKAIAAGLGERQVRLAERQIVLLGEVLRAVSLDPALALSDAQRAALPEVIRAHVGLEQPRARGALGPARPAEAANTNGGPCWHDRER